MESLRKWFCRPKKDDKSLLAQFFFADEALNLIANELDSFDGRKDPERCTALVNQLRQSQDRVLTITNAIMDILIVTDRANRDFRVKFPEDVLQDNLAGQLWFGAECLAAGSSIMNREIESAQMRPLAKALTKTLENVRNLLREACLRNNTPNGPLKLNSDETITEMLVESLKIFDRLFAEFELSYVSAMVPVKTTQEYELQELIGVLFSETLQRALKMKLLTQEMVDDYDPALMFTIPRLAIVSGLLVFPDGPLCIDKPVEEMSEMFRPFRTLLHKIRELLWTLNKRELYMLEKLLCDNEQITDLKSVSELSEINSDLDDFVNKFYNDYPTCKDFVSNFYTVTVSNGTDVEADFGNDAAESLPEKNLCDNLEKELTRDSRSETSNDKTPVQVSANIEIPSTSGYLIANTVTHDSIVASLSENTEPPVRAESLPDNDCLEVVSAKLSSILLTKDEPSQNNKQTPNDTSYKSKIPSLPKEHLNDKIKSRVIESLDSPDDSGICTENTSLDRSPSLDFNDVKNCNCVKSDTNLDVPCQCNIKSDKSDYLGCKQVDHAGSQTNKCTYKLRTETKVGVGAGISNASVNSKHLKVVKTPCVQKASEEDNVSVGSSDTSSFNSNCADDEEIALAIQAAEIANRNEVRAKFRSSEDLVHRLFVCIAGVADQLQTNFASDLRNILKSVFLINATNFTETPLDASIEYHPTESEIIENNEFSVDPNILAQEALFDSNVYFHVDDQLEDGEHSEYSNHPRTNSEDMEEDGEPVNNFVSLGECVVNTSPVNGIPCTSNDNEHDTPPIWIPDVEAPKCMSCGANFTVVKRRHHCRNCGKIFCARCSSNSVPLPKYGHIKPVRVCNKCFLYHLTPFTM